MSTDVGQVVEPPADLPRIRAALSRLRAIAARQGGDEACRVVAGELPRESAQSGQDGAAKGAP